MNTYPHIEFGTEQGQVVARLCISEHGFAVWHISKDSIFEEMRMRRENKQLTWFNFVRLMKELLGKKEFDMEYKVEEQDEELDDLTTMFVDVHHQTLQARLKKMLEDFNPYSEKVEVRPVPSNEWKVPGQPEYFLSGPNFCSDPFSTRKAARSSIMELQTKGEVGQGEEQLLFGLISGISLPEGPAPGTLYN